MNRITAIGVLSLCLIGMQACVKSELYPVYQDPQSPPPTPPPSALPSVPLGASPTSPVDGDWQLIGADRLEVRPVHLKIAGPQFGADAGCNKIRGGIQFLEGGRLRITKGPSTLIGCPDNYDDHFLAALSSAYAYRLSPAHLTLFTGLGQLTFARQEALAQLEGSWKVVGLNNGKGGLVSSINQPKQFVSFQNGRINGHDGCNSMGGEYKLKGNKISISAYPITRKSCGNPDIPWDRALYAALAAAANVELSSGQVILRSAAGAQQVVLRRGG